MPIILFRRHIQRGKRIYLLDRRIDHIAGIKFDDLGHWMRTRLKKIGQYTIESQHLVANSGLSAAELHQQWDGQRRSQQSIRSRKI